MLTKPPQKDLRLVGRVELPPIANRAAEQPRVHRDRGAVVGHRGLVVLVDEVVAQKVEVAVRELLAVHLLQTVGQQAAVQADEVLLGQLADERGDVLVLDVGVGVVLRARRGVRGVAVVGQEAQLLALLALLGVALAVEHVALRHGEVALGHEGHLHLVLNLLDGHAVGDVHAAQYGREVVVRGVAADRQKGLADGPFDLLDGERLAFAVALDDVKFRNAHGHPFFMVVRSGAEHPPSGPSADRKVALPDKNMCCKSNSSGLPHIPRAGVRVWQGRSSDSLPLRAFPSRGTVAC